MPTVDFQPFANGGSANVETQSQFVADIGSGGSLQNGFQAGLAKSAQMNKVWRQASMIAAAVANFIADQLGTDVLDDGNLTSLIALLSKALGAVNYVADTGAANAYVVTMTPALAAHVVGMPIRVKWANTNTGASTFNDGAGAVALVRRDGTALLAGDVIAGAIGTVVWDGTRFQLMTGSLPVSFENTQNYGTPGTYTFTVPAGVFWLKARVWGGGAGGGGSAATGAGSGGGGGGGYGEKMIAVTPGQNITVIVGSGGAGGGGGGGTAFNGNAGGTSSVGSSISCTGGTANQTASTAGGLSGTGGQCTGGDIASQGGAGGTGTSSFGGYGGSSGSTGSVQPSSGAGAGGAAPGGGGGGAINAAGGNGGNGLVILNW